MEQKFKRGNLVEVTFGSPMWNKGEDGEYGVSDIRKDLVGRKAVVEYSYAERYGSGEANDKASYSIAFLDDGNSISWFNDSQLKFIEKGGEHLIEEAKAVWEKRIAQKPKETIQDAMYRMGVMSKEEKEAQAAFAKPILDRWHKSYQEAREKNPDLSFFDFFDREIGFNK